LPVHHWQHWKRNTVTSTSSRKEPKCFELLLSLVNILSLE
jgi:hypothetical protein